MDLHLKGAIYPVPPQSQGFLSNLFLVKKKDGGHRPVINLRDLNYFVKYQHFKMEGIHLLKDLLIKDDWMVKIDLKDAYLTVPVHPSHHPYLQFLWKNQKWQFQSLPFGLSSAPWCFTKLLKPVVAMLRSRGVRLIIYLDDILIMAQTLHLINLHTQWTLSLFTNLGFLINTKKSVLTPSKEVEFLGFSINTQLALLSLPNRKLSLIRKEIPSILNKKLICLRSLARIVGLLSASIQAIFPAPLHYRALQRLKAQHLREGLSYSDQVTLNSDTEEELLWWLHHIQEWNGKAIFNFIPDHILESDASRLGWGARCGHLSTGGKWSEGEATLHINCLELLAGFFALKSFARDKSHCCILLKMDNISAVQYINRLGGTKSKPLANIAKEIWHFCLDKNIVLKAEYLPGLSNIVADWNSRYLIDNSDWKLDHQIFLQINSLWGPLSIDLFASRLNRQIPQFFSWRPDPEALGVDAFLQFWPPSTLYAFPPFALISRLHRLLIVGLHPFLFLFPSGILLEDTKPSPEDVSKIPI
ncbi:uncharacterized protein LOC130311793 [Hyla sarda]|uniref:uncharacterized protein LOC130311793 n=1 Tax=Hyla sarda TaxID=327740 RepID=UPI0024C31BB3|nr:uncharacterized protein LOC130311793 [Hyla sarda]